MLYYVLYCTGESSQSAVRACFAEEPPFAISPSLFYLLPGQVEVLQVCMQSLICTINRVLVNTAYVTFTLVSWICDFRKFPCFRLFSSPRLLQASLGASPSSVTTAT